MNQPQALESRMMMSVTVATLNTDYSSILGDRAPVTAALVPDATAISTGTKAIAADVKGLGSRAQKAENAHLISQIRKDESRFLSALKTDAAQLTQRGTTLSAQAKAAGAAYLKKPTTARGAKITSSVSHLNAVVTTALNQLLADNHLATLVADLNSIVVANPGNTKLATDSASLSSAVTVTAIDGAANVFANATVTLANDLNSIINPIVAVGLDNATATFEQSDPGNFPVSSAIDGAADQTSTGWAINGGEGQNQAAVFQVNGAPIGTGTTKLTFTLSQIYSNPSDPTPFDFHTIGKFKLSVTNAANPTATSNITWTDLSNVTFTDDAGEVPVSIAADGTILLPSTSPDTAVYTVTATTTLTGITGFRLLALTDNSLPFLGPGRQPLNGNFVLSQFQVTAQNT